MDIDSRRIVSGGRFGEIVIWSLSDCLETTEQNTQPDDRTGNDIDIYSKGRSIHLHERSTAVGQIKIKNGLLISCDGVGQIVVSDFWNVNKV